MNLPTFLLGLLAGCSGDRSQVVETLSRAVPVFEVSGDALALSHTSQYLISGGPFSQPATIAIWEATRSGVEFDDEGRPIGLLRIHHWCGNDPISDHVARVPIVEFAQFIENAGVFEWDDQCGWNWSQYSSFERSLGGSESAAQHADAADRPEAGR